MTLTQNDKADRIYDAFSNLNEIVVDAKKETAHLIPGLETLMARVTYLKEVCTIHIQTSRRAGHSSTIFEFIEDEELKAVYLTSNYDHLKLIKKQVNVGDTRLGIWKDANKISFKDINAIFVDPATHACKKAMHCIYDRAAEQLALTGEAPTIYLVS